ncbi:putative Ufm1-specific protease 1 [Daphnia magna]|uniref:Putative Ufm1-specific protease 1 n=1 Tax=Daphnia magna TaxID=35525 RepID=A0A164PCK1_9CRUS|nr:putative Ufm1-specific protease 1 [Daphnia magna]
MALLSNVHSGLSDPTTSPQKKVHITNSYVYYHYKCDGYNDVGWGCGYRTLQTIASHLSLQDKQGKAVQVPTLMKIQETLVEIGDKELSFIKSREWIGSFEVCLVIDKLYDVPCKILHCPSGGMTSIFPKLEEHFAKSSSAPPIMMGGDRDASSKGVLGTCSVDDDRWLLVLDPHYQGGQTSAAKLQREGYIRWIHLSEFDKQSFYNICLPQFSNVLCTI